MHSNRPQRGPPPCKFGQNCKHLAQGTCTFYHPNNPQGQNPNINSNNNPRFANQQGPQHQNYPPQNYNNPRQDMQQGGGSGWGNKPPFQKNFNQGVKAPFYKQNFPPKGDDFTSKFCMSYHYNQPCKYEQKGKCSRIHGFDLNDKIRRVSYDSSIPPQQPSKLGKFVKDGQVYLILRMGNGIAILTFNNETSTFNSLTTWKFPKPELKYTYYGQKQNFIYIAAQNPKSTLYDIWIYDMITSALITIQQAHSSPVTQVIHFTNSILFSSSKDGYIKIWTIAGNAATIDKQSTQNLFNTYTTGKACQILFLDLSVINGLKILTAGTNDNRILFFLGQQMNFRQLNLNEKHALVYKIKYCTIDETALAIVLSWTRDMSASTLISIPLNNLTFNQIIQVDAKQNPRNNIAVIQTFQDRLLFIANLSGHVTVYSLPSMEKVGAFLHRSPVNSIVFAQYITKTQIKIPQIYMLQSKYQQKNGSLGVYNIKK